MGFLARILGIERRKVEDALTIRLLQVDGVFGVGFGWDEVYVHVYKDISLRTVTDIVSKMELKTEYLWDIRILPETGAVNL